MRELYLRAWDRPIKSSQQQQTVVKQPRSPIKRSAPFMIILELENKQIVPNITGHDPSRCTPQPQHRRFQRIFLEKLISQQLTQKAMCTNDLCITHSIIINRESCTLIRSKQQLPPLLH